MTTPGRTTVPTNIEFTSKKREDKKYTDNNMLHCCSRSVLPDLLKEDKAAWLQKPQVSRYQTLVSV